ncbi:MAG: ATP-binding protein, partial [Melioribacteraceae bacterium]
FEKINLKNVARAVISDLSVLILESEATIILSSLPTISVDESQLRQLFQNLIGNAVKFSKSDVLPEIKIYSEKISNDDESSKGIRNEDCVKIIIEDNGIGIDMEYSEKIFGVFERLHGRSEYKGTGIGLSIVKKIVERHNGKIILKSELDVGTKFEIYLPKENKVSIT